MIDAQSTNATATFLVESADETTDEEWTPYDDTDSGSDDWDPVHEGVGVLYEPQGSEFVTEAGGDTAYRQERIIAPLHIDDAIESGNRVVVNYRGRELNRRITEPRVRSMDGFQGYCEITLQDWGDQ